MLSHFSFEKRLSLNIAIILVILFLLSSCAFPGKSTNSQSSNSSTDKNLLTIQFNLQLHSALQEDEKIGIEILDEVTGLPYNVRQYEMKKADDLLYASNLSFIAGSIVKYRYIKISESISNEVTSDGQPIRYRLFYLDKTKSITDILQSWEREKRINAVGLLSGTLIDIESEQPIPDILVSAGGQLTFTDTNGQFLIPNLASGIHNVVFYAIDGKYRTFQQGASISSGMETQAHVALTPMPMVNITFHVNAPIDALGAPIYMAGNIIQLGNTFTDLNGGMSIKPKRMPKLIPQEDGTYKIDLELYAETDLRYKFTLGDGYWNAEQQSSNGFLLRQFVIPNHDVKIDVSINSWRSTGIEPIIFNASIPSDNTSHVEKYIQFKTTQWTEPLPLWPLGNSNYLYILYSPLNKSFPISYRYCRSDNCADSHNTMASEDMQVLPSETEQSINDMITSWENWHTLDPTTDVIPANIPAKDNGYKTAIELSPQMDSSWLTQAMISLSEFSKNGVTQVIYSPQWFLQSNTPHLLPSIGKTPFYYELTQMLSTAQSLGMSTSIYPHIGPFNETADWWNSQSHNAPWWDQWFDSYEKFILNYAKLAEFSDSSALIIGGKTVLPAFSEGVHPDGSPTDAPETIDERWQTLISDIREIYSGQLIWATNASLEMDPLPSFIDLFDEIYIAIDSPLAQGQEPTFDEISSNFNTVIDTLIFEIHRSTLKPISIGLAYPSADGGVQGCYLVSENCYNDGLFLPDDEVTNTSVDLDEQTLIYNAIMPISASREWITGIAIRGVDPTISLQDASSSIIGKPAWDIIHYWFSGLTAVD
jgi:hypothetical protein